MYVVCCIVGCEFVSLLIVFYGDLVVKVVLLVWIDVYLVVGILFFECICWYDGCGSVLGVLIGGIDFVVYVDVFGYLFNFVVLFDLLVGFFVDGFDIFVFVCDWVDVVVLGVDLCLVLICVMLEMFDVCELCGCYELVLIGIIILYLCDLGDDVLLCVEWVVV